MRHDVHAMTVTITKPTHCHNGFLPKGQRTYLLVEIDPIFFGLVSPDLTMASYELVESKLLDPNEGKALIRAYKALGKGGDIVSLADVHKDLVDIVEKMSRTQHTDVDAYRRRLKAVLGYAEDCLIVLYDHEGRKVTP